MTRATGFLERLAKSSIVAFLLGIIILHAYCHAVLFSSPLPLMLWRATLVFELVLLAGIILAWVVAEKVQPRSLFTWLTYLLLACFGIFEFIQYNGYQDLARLFPFFPLAVAMLYAWAALVLVSVGVLVVVGIKAIRQGLGKQTLVPSFRAMKKKAIVMFTAGLLCLVLAEPVARWANQEDQVLYTLEIEDNNHLASLSVWDLPRIEAQVGNTEEIDLGLLTVEENRTLLAFARMNTTFYAQLYIDTEHNINRTISTLKLLDAFNLTFIWTIWYPDDPSFPHFVSAAHAPAWIANARAVLEFVIARNLTNVLGICADSEQAARVSYQEYWDNIHLYDAFLTEVQTNLSLRHPDPLRGTFETVLTFEPLAPRDLVDGDLDLVTGQRKLGLPPGSWTRHHFMTYRQNNDHVPGELYSYLLLMEQGLGLDKAAPIVGVTGVQWFAEGYYNGTSEQFVYGPQPYQYDGIDGWDAMKREILFCKAWGFHTVSVFHLNSYETGTLAVENYGLLDYYGLERVEELADEWNASKTIHYPVIAPRFSLGQRGLFRPLPEIRYDLLVNVETSVMNLVLLASIPLALAFSFRKHHEKGRDGSS